MWGHRYREFWAGKIDRSSKGQLTGQLQWAEVSGMSLIKQALTEKIHVDKECLVNADKISADDIRREL